MANINKFDCNLNNKFYSYKKKILESFNLKNIFDTECFVCKKKDQKFYFLLVKNIIRKSYKVIMFFNLRFLIYKIIN